MPLEEDGVEPFLQYVQPDFTAIEFDDRVTRPGGRAAHGQKSLASDQFIEVGPVLHRVVETELVEAAEVLPFDELVHVQCQSRLVVPLPERPGRPLQV